MREKSDSIQSAIVSRVLALVLTAFPLAAVGSGIDRADRLAIQNYSTHEELRAYVEANFFGGFWVAFGIVLLVGFGYVALVEGVALVLRVAWRRVPGVRDED